MPYAQTHLRSWNTPRSRVLSLASALPTARPTPQRRPTSFDQYSRDRHNLVHDVIDNQKCTSNSRYANRPPENELHPFRRCPWIGSLPWFGVDHPGQRQENLCAAPAYQSRNGWSAFVLTSSPADTETLGSPKSASVWTSWHVIGGERHRM